MNYDEKNIFLIYDFDIFIIHFFFWLNTFTVSAYVDNDLDSEYSNVETILNEYI